MSGILVLFHTGFKELKKILSDVAYLLLEYSKIHLS